MVEIAKLKELKNQNTKLYKSELKELEKELFGKYCIKRGYYKECDPAYCSFRFSNSCEFIKRWSEILNELKE